MLIRKRLVKIGDMRETVEELGISRQSRLTTIWYFADQRMIRKATRVVNDSWVSTSTTSAPTRPW